MTPTTCRHCGAAVLRVVEDDVRAAALQATVEADPVSAPVRSPPGLTVWTYYDRHGWACLDDPASAERFGRPIHIEHKCQINARPDQAKPKENPMGFWDDPAIAVTDGDFVKFDNIGDSITGRIAGMSTKTFTNDNGGTDIVPQILLVTEDGAEKTLTAGAVLLRKRLIEQKPDVGDEVRVTYVGKEGKTKHYTVEVRRLNGAAAPAASTGGGAPF